MKSLHRCYITITFRLGIALSFDLGFTDLRRVLHGQ
nr:MAG TPA: hypothetical protein [Caudoviricetes sp.]